MSQSAGDFQIVDEPAPERGSGPSPLQTSLPLDLGEPGGGITVRPDLNLEKWPVWEASNSRHLLRARTLQREIRLPDGSVAVAKVEVGFTNNGALTTEDQKTCYALFRVWEESGKPEGRVHFTRQQLARVLKRSWGSKVNKAITESLLRLRFTPFVWERSYFDSSRQETIERIDTFNILSELHLTRRARGETTLAESSYFEFNDRILANLMAGFTRPVYLDTILTFQSEVAQILYTHLDLVMADKTRYERRSQELFDELGIDGASYKFPSKRLQVLRPAVDELQGVEVPTGVLSVSIDRTSDKQDYKIVAVKSRKVSGRRLELRPPEPPPPVVTVTRIVNAPRPAPKRKIAKKPVQPSLGAGMDIGSSDGVEAHMEASRGLLEPVSNPVSPDQKAEEQVRHFYQVFFQAGETARPTARELALAAEHVRRLGAEKAQYLVQFARRESRKTDFEIQNYGGLSQYEGRAVAEFDANERQRREALEQRAREAHRRLWLPAYLDYLRARLAELDAAPGEGFEAFLEEERRGRARLAPVQRLVQEYDSGEARLARFREFLRQRADRGEKVEGVLPFWEWDQTLNPEGLSDVR